VEVGRRSADVVDVALETRQFRQKARFAQNRGTAPGLDDPPLMGGKGAKGASSEAAAVGGDAEFHFLQGGNPALRFAGRVPLPGIGEFIDGVELFRSHGP